MNPLIYLQRPEYLLRPTQAWRRVQRLWRKMKAKESVVLPWNARLTVHTNERIGVELFCYGIFDKIVPEAIARLADSGDFTIEVGANIGQNCSLMAVKVGPSGTVLAFEPHPEIFHELRENAASWPKEVSDPIRLENIALGESIAELLLVDGAEFGRNRGSAALAVSSENKGRAFKVPVRPLDDYLANVPQVGLCKIDVEGHELQVLRGTIKAFRRGAIRDIIYEDFNPQPSAVSELLVAHGFHLFQLVERWLKPTLIPIAQASTTTQGFSWNYLATRDPERAVQRFKSPGWLCLLNR